MLGRAATALLATFLLSGTLVPAGVGATLQVRRVARPEAVARLHRKGLPVPAVASAEDIRVQQERARRWRSFHDVLSAPGTDWSLRAQRRAGWRPAPERARGPHAAMALAPAETPPETLKVAFILVDFRSDRGGSASTGDGHFDLSGPDPNNIPIDPPPRNHAFFASHLEALSRYYDAMSYGRVVVTGDVWPRGDTPAYSLTDMADYGPWTFSQEIYRAAVHLFRDMFFAADTQSAALGDHIPWRSYDRFVLIHAGSDLQSDVRQDSKEDIPSFTLTVGDTDRVVFRDSTICDSTADPADPLAKYCPIDRASIIPETINQDGYYGAINGVLAHESGHNFFGLADLYNIETGLPVVGYWSLMDSGNLAGSKFVFQGDTLFATGMLPPSVDPWQRFFVTDALAFPEVGYADTTALANSERNPDVRRVTLSSDEYLLLENRYLAPADIIELDQDSLTHVILGPKNPDRFEYDALLPGTGILAWHIDESVIPFSTSLRVNADYGFNTNPDRYGISVLEADGLMDLGDTGSPYLLGAPFDPWFLDNNPVLSDTTFPDLVPHIGTRPHKQLSFLDDPGLVMHLAARRTWELPGWPVAADFPPGGPLLLAVDANGDRDLEVCWAGGHDSLEVEQGGRTVRVADPDSAALFAVRADGLGLDSTRAFAFAHLDRRPMPVMAALPIGEASLPGFPAVGPAYFAATTYAAGPDTSSPGGRVWLVDHRGQPLPGWPAPLPVVATTPPVIAGLYPNASVLVGCADGRVYAIGLGGDVTARSDPPLGAPISGRLAVDVTPGYQVCAAGSGGAQSLPLHVGAASADGEVAIMELRTQSPGVDSILAVCPPRRLGGPGFAPDLLWIPFDGAAPLVAGKTAPAATCGVGVPALVVHEADKLWALCADGTPLPGWGHSYGDTILAGLGAGDPDGDGLPKVLTQTVHSGLAFVNRTGYPSPGWPKPGTVESLRTDSPPLALDVDGDGRSEVVGMNASGIVAAIRADGGTPDGWPLATGSGATGSPVAADLNRDGSLDLVAPDRFGLLYAYTLPVALRDLVANSWTMLGGDPGRSSALPVSSTPAAPAASAGPLASGSLIVYPNPARRHPVSFAFRLTEPAEVEFRILDTSGHQVASFSRSGLQGENVQIWEPGQLPAGLYLARVRFQGAGTEHVEILQVGLLR